MLAVMSAEMLAIILTVMVAVMLAVKVAEMLVVMLAVMLTEMLLVKLKRLKNKHWKIQHQIYRSKRNCLLHYQICITSSKSEFIVLFEGVY